MSELSQYGFIPETQDENQVSSFEKSIKKQLNIDYNQLQDRMYNCYNFCFKNKTLLDENITINQVPGYQQITIKRFLAQNVMKQKQKQLRLSVPNSFNLPDNYFQLKQHMDQHPDQYYIVKPVNGMQGKGIFITNNISEIEEHYPKNITITNDNANQLAVVQQYITNNCHYNGRKYDIRFYILVTSLDPFIVYYYNESMVRLASQQEEMITQENKDQLKHFITNAAFNKNESKTQELKILTSDLFKYYEENNEQFDEDIRDKINVQYLQKQLKQAIVNTLISSYSKWLQTGIKESSEEFIYNYPHKYYGIYGGDAILLKNGTFMIFEFNRQPSLSIKSYVDKQIKPQLLEQVYQLIGINSYLDISQVQFDKQMQQEIDFYNEKYNQLNLLNDDQLSEDERNRLLQLVDEFSRCTSFQPLNLFSKIKNQGKYNNLVGNNLNKIIQESKKLKEFDQQMRDIKDQYRAKNEL